MTGTFPEEIPSDGTWDQVGCLSNQLSAWAKLDKQGDACQWQKQMPKPNGTC